MKKYRKRPVVVEAIQWIDDNLAEVVEFLGGLQEDEYKEVVKDKRLKIYTLEGPLYAKVGDYLIKGINGEVYPCKPDIFQKTYEEVDLT